MSYYSIHSHYARYHGTNKKELIKAKNSKEALIQHLKKYDYDGDIRLSKKEEDYDYTVTQMDSECKKKYGRNVRYKLC